MLATWLAGRRWRMVSGVYRMQLEASAYLDHGRSVPPAAMQDGARRTLVCSWTTRAATPHAPGRSRRRSCGFSGQMVDYGRVSKPCSAPWHFLSDRLLGQENTTEQRHPSGVRKEPTCFQ